MVSNIKGLSTENMIVQKKQFYTMFGIGQGGCLEELVSKLTHEVKKMMGRRDPVIGMNTEGNGLEVRENKVHLIIESNSASIADYLPMCI